MWSSATETDLCGVVSGGGQGGKGQRSCVKGWKMAPCLPSVYIRDSTSASSLMLVRGVRAPSMALAALRRTRPSLLRWGRTLCTQKAPVEPENNRWWHGSFDAPAIKDTDEEGTASAHAVLVSRSCLAAPVRAAPSPPHATTGCLVPPSHRYSSAPLLAAVHATPHQSPRSPLRR